jgi:hypothetical protein
MSSTDIQVPVTLHSSETKLLYPMHSEQIHPIGTAARAGRSDRDLL